MAVEQPGHHRGTNQSSRLLGVENWEILHDVIRLTPHFHMEKRKRTLEILAVLDTRPVHRYLPYYGIVESQSRQGNEKSSSRPAGVGIKLFESSIYRQDEMWPPIVLRGRRSLVSVHDNTES